jgi:hypothetical protein
VIPGDPWSKRLQRIVRELLGPDLPPTEGGCWIVADAMQTAWGGELAVVWGGTYDMHADDMAHHVYVALAPDVLVDGEGVHTAEAMEEKADAWDVTYGVWLGHFDPYALMAVSTPPPFEGERKDRLVAALRQLGTPPVARQNPREERTGRRPLYRGVSPWEMQQILDTGEVYGAGGADFREDCQTFFAEELEDAIHHGSMYWRYFVWHHPLFREGVAPINRLRKIKQDLYEIRQGLDWFHPDHDRVVRISDKVGALLSKLEGRLSRAAWAASGTAFKRSGALDADSYVIELAGVEGGVRYTGRDNLGGQGLSEVCFPPGRRIPLENARVHFVKDSTLTGAVRDPRAPDPWHLRNTGREVYWRKIAIPKVSLRRLAQARDYVLKHKPRIEKLSHEAYALMSTDQNPRYGRNPPRARRALKKVRRAVGEGRLCYPSAEVVYHAGGGKRAGLTPMQQRHEGASHWWVRGPDGEVYDPAAAQFRTRVPYEEGRGRGFLTKRPSRRARVLGRMAGVRVNPGGDVTSREEAIAWTRSESVLSQRRSAFPAGSNKRRVWEAGMRAMWDGDEPTGVRQRDAIRRAVNEVFPPEAALRAAAPGACPRCGGSGHIRAYGHVLGGECFGCGGSGRI